jgi:thioester reductase-like protein
MQLVSSRGFQVSIYRSATVAADNINGVWNSDDFLYRLLKGCLQLALVDYIIDLLSSTAIKLRIYRRGNPLWLP